MTSKKLQIRQQLAVQGGRATRKPRANMLSHLRAWILGLAMIVGLLNQLGIPDLVMVHTMIHSGWIGHIKVITEPTGSLHLEMDNRPGIATHSENQQSKETKTGTS